MSDEKRYELTTTLSIVNGSRDLLDQYVAHFDSAVLAVLSDYPTVNAYYVRPLENAFEIEIGLRFEGMPPKNIESTAMEILDESIARVTDVSSTGPAPVREETTLVPA